MRGQELPPSQMVYETTGPLGSPRWWLYWESNPGSRFEGPASRPLDDRALATAPGVEPSFEGSNPTLRPAPAVLETTTGIEPA